MIAASLTSELERYVSQLGGSEILRKARSGDVSFDVVDSYLVSVQFLLRHTEPNLRRARLLSELRGSLVLAGYFREKLLEEAGHERWADDDIAHLAAIRGCGSSAEPLPAVVALMDRVSSAIEQEPALYAVYILFVEYVTAKIGPDWVRALRTGCGVPADALSVAIHHVELDGDHACEGLSFIESLEPDATLSAEMLGMLRDSMRLFSRFCDELSERAARAA